MDNAATMQRTYELINAGDIDGFGDLLAEGFIEHEEAAWPRFRRPGVLKMFHRAYKASFPDLHMHAEEILSSGDKTVAQGEGRRGPIRGSSWACPRPTARAVEMQLIDIMRFDEAGLVCEHWGVMDMLTMLQQLGAAIPDGAVPG